MFVIGSPSAPVAVPAFVCRSIGWQAMCKYGSAKGWHSAALTALTYTGIQNFHEDLVFPRERDGIAVVELNRAALFRDNGSRLGLGDGRPSCHCMTAQLGLREALVDCCSVKATLRCQMGQISMPPSLCSSCQSLIFKSGTHASMDLFSSAFRRPSNPIEVSTAL